MRGGYAGPSLPMISLLSTYVHNWAAHTCIALGGVCTYVQRARGDWGLRGVGGDI